MNICIVTYYRNENPGSVLQAYALQLVLKNDGHNIVFYRNTISSHTVRHLLLRIVNSIIRCRIYNAKLFFSKYILFSKAHHLLNEIHKDNLSKSDINCYILGSDVIWSMEHQPLKKRLPFFGYPFVGTKIISYAVSAANTTSERFTQIGLIPGSLNHISSLSVRDQHTKDIVQPLTETPIALVCDPTLLLSTKDYQIFEKTAPSIGSYIVLYLFEGLSDQMINNLQTFARQTNRKIVSLSLNDYADIMLPCDPWNFITYYKHADYIITDTFHGTLFSIIFERQFLSVQCGKNKVNDLLGRLLLTDRIFHDNDELLLSLEKPIDWSVPNRILDELREQSLQFLSVALKNINIDS